jgi:hypothetical protein
MMVADEVGRIWNEVIMIMFPHTCMLNHDTSVRIAVPGAERRTQYHPYTKQNSSHYYETFGARIEYSVHIIMNMREEICQFEVHGPIFYKFIIYHFAYMNGVKRSETKLIINCENSLILHRLSSVT